MGSDELVARLRQLAVQIDPLLLGGPDARLLNEAADEIERLTAQLAEARESERAAVERAKLDGVRLRIALHDAIRRPMGVVPASADEFYSPAEADAAERRRAARAAALSELAAADAVLLDLPDTLADSDGDDGA